MVNIEKDFGTKYIVEIKQLGTCKQLIKKLVKNSGK